MTQHRLLMYVSIKTRAFQHQAAADDDIVAVSTRRNAQLNVTGALVSTRDYYAQILEGPHDAVDTLMTSICRDYRHRDVRVVLDQAERDRRFERWSLLYTGAGTYFSQHVQPLVEPTTSAAPGDAFRLFDLMRSMASA